MGTFFVSSEMETSTDMSRRKAVAAAVESLGHHVSFFEGSPARPFPPGTSARSHFLSLVRHSDALLFVVDDAVTEPMHAELEEARKTLGPEHIFYYFTNSPDRQQSALQLWNQVRDSNLLGKFDDETQLANEVKRTIGSYIDDALRRTRSRRPEVLLETVWPAEDDVPKSWMEPLQAGDRTSATLTATSSFQAVLCDAQKFVELNQGGLHMWSEERPAFQFDLRVSRDDDYYLVVLVPSRISLDDLEASPEQSGAAVAMYRIPTPINVRWVRR